MTLVLASPLLWSHVFAAVSAAPAGGCPAQTLQFDGVGAFVNFFLLRLNVITGVFVESAMASARDRASADVALLVFGILSYD